MPSTPPLVSIVMTARNAASVIEPTLHAIRAQTHPDFELVAVNNQSTDATPQILLRHAAEDHRVRVLHSPALFSVPGGRNLATSEARGRYIAYCDADDVWHPQKLEKQLGRLRATGGIACATWFRRIDGAGAPISGAITLPAQVRLRDVIGVNILCCSSVMYDSAKVGKLHMVDYVAEAPLPWYLKRFRRLPYFEDYVAWVQLLQRNPRDYAFETVPEVLCDYRVQGGSLSGNKLVAALVRWHLFRGVLGLTWWRSATLFADYAAGSLLRRLRWAAQPAQPA